jgi:hypothetical protein
MTFAGMTSNNQQEAGTNAISQQIFGAVSLLGLAFALSQVSTSGTLDSGRFSMRMHSIQTLDTVSVSSASQLVGMDYQLLDVMVEVQQDLIRYSTELPWEVKEATYGHLWELYD